MAGICEEIRARLEELRDEANRDFQCRLIPGLTPERALGVRTPALRKLAKEFSQREDAGEFMAALPHELFDENNLHALILSEEREYDRAVTGVDAFLPFVDNWATCDSLRPTAFRKNHDRLEGEIRRWMGSSEPFTVRFGMEMLMAHFLDGDFRPEQLEWVEKIDSNHYYVNMMAAWYFATALAKQYTAAVTYLEEARLSPWVHNKTIQKAVESFRVTEEHKAHLRVLRRKIGGEE